MTDPFILTVHYKNAELHFTAHLQLRGYRHKFRVLINETEVYFEPDEEGQYRAVKMPGQNEKDIAAIDTGLLYAVQQKIASILA